MRTDPWNSLRGEKYISLTTFRRNGQGVATPVWFAELRGKIVVYTVDNSGKVKRIRNTARVEIAACDRTGKVHGPVLSGMARFLAQAEVAGAEAALNRKYPTKRIMNIFARFRPTPRAYLEIAPA